MYYAGPLWSFPREKGWSDMEWQLRNWLYFTWLSGDHIVEQACHSLDKMAWAMRDEYPVRASGIGGRQAAGLCKRGRQSLSHHVAGFLRERGGLKLFRLGGIVLRAVDSRSQWPATPQHRGRRGAKRGRARRCRLGGGPRRLGVSPAHRGAGLSGLTHAPSLAARDLRRRRGIWLGRALDGRPLQRRSALRSYAPRVPGFTPPTGAATPI